MNDVVNVVEINDDSLRKKIERTGKNLEKKYKKKQRKINERLLKKKSPLQKVFSIIFDVICVIFLLFSAVVCFSTINSQFQNMPPMFAGFMNYKVQTTSMVASGFNRYDNFTARAVDAKTLDVGDIIVFYPYTKEDTLFRQRYKDVAEKVEGKDKQIYCSEVFERTIPGSHGATVKVKYDNSNPFGLVAGEFGEISTLSKYSTDNAQKTTIDNFNSLSESFASFLGSFQIPKNGTAFTPIISATAIMDKYTDFFDKARVLYNNTYVGFTKAVNSEVAKSAVIGANYPYKMIFGDDDIDEIDFQLVIANLFGFESKEDFMICAQNLAEVCEIYRNSNSSNGVLDNGAFFTNNQSFVFPVAIKNNISSKVLSYIIVDKDGFVSVWINSIESFLKTANFDNSQPSGTIINNELYCKNTLFVTPTRSVAYKFDFQSLLGFQTEAIKQAATSGCVPVVHHIYEIYQTPDGTRWFKTKGSSNPFVDSWIISENMILGAYDNGAISQFFSKVISVFSSEYGILLIILPVVLLATVIFLECLKDVQLAFLELDCVEEKRKITDEICVKNDVGYNMDVKTKYKILAQATPEERNEYISLLWRDGQAPKSVQKYIHRKGVLYKYNQRMLELNRECEKMYNDGISMARIARIYSEKKAKIQEMEENETKRLRKISKIINERNRIEKMLKEAKEKLQQEISD